jgi:hypothetical protein
MRYSAGEEFLPFEKSKTGRGLLDEISDKIARGGCHSRLPFFLCLFPHLPLFSGTGGFHQGTGDAAYP